METYVRTHLKRMFKGHFTSSAMNKKTKNPKITLLKNMKLKKSISFLSKK